MNTILKKGMLFVAFILLVCCKSLPTVESVSEKEEVLPLKLASFKLGVNDEKYLINSAIKKDYDIFFSGNILSFDTLLIGKGENKYLSTYIEINKDSLVFHKMTNKKVYKAYKHDLSLKNNFSLSIKRKLKTTNITIINEKDTLVIDSGFFIGMKKPFVRSLGSVIDVNEFSFNCDDYQSDIALFGDSYMNCGSAQRWPYYVYNKGYQFFCDGLPGSKSIDSYDFIKSSFSVHKPKYVVWCLGMNDKSDENGVVDPSWKYYTNKVMKLCKENNVTLILSTTPSVPTRNHIEKNKFVRNSGYRYIDFDKAVSDGKGNWNEELLAKDGVHPTKNGARVLSEAFLSSFPEIKMYTDSRMLK